MFNTTAALVVGAGVVVKAVPPFEGRKVGVAEFPGAWGVEVGPDGADIGGNLAPVGRIGGQRVGADVAPEAQ